ncbi:YcdB/YcdC domain-containing protein [Saccharibacillus qingshengii]|uniref:YcdB/YcdC domain-containing protein n=1 Tax=Saccharibacillus qingshengii TaxID=1763540 RepID=UPI001553177B|nr:YcdB/YcdC domain-containing protein [Saccharibacillus qingshengii]
MKTGKWEFASPRAATAAVLAAALLCAPAGGIVSAAETGGAESFSSATLTKAIPEGAKVSSAAAAAAVQKLFPELTPARLAAADYSAYYASEADANKTWRLTYEFTGQENASASVSVDAVSGVLVDAYLPASGAGDAKLKREEASERALAFVLKAMPGKSASDFAVEAGVPAYEGSGSVTPLFGSSNHTFSFRLKVNGVPSQSETVFVALSGGGEIVNYTRSINRLPYPSAVPTLSAAEARRAYEADFGLKLAYIPENGWGGIGSRYYLGYMPYDESAAPIDAASGKQLDTATGLPYANTVAREGEAIKSSNLSAAAMNPLKTEEAAQNRLTRLGLIPDGYKLSGQQTYTQDYPQKDTKVWVLDLNRTVQGETGNVNAQLNADTGQLYNYYRYEPNTSGGNVQPTAADKSHAVDWAAKLLPNAAQWRLVSVPSSSSWTLAYGFQRYEAGLPVVGDTAIVTVDKKGGLSEFYVSEPSASKVGAFPPAASAKLTAAEATAKFLEATELRLAYSRFDRPSDNAGQQPDAKMILTYLPVSASGADFGISTILDAADGTWKSLYGANAAQPDSPEASDFAGHANQAALEKMVEHGVLVPDAEGRVNPDTPLTRGEWADMLARAAQPDYPMYNGDYGGDLFRDTNEDSPYRAAIGFLISQGWLTPDRTSDFKPEAGLTRDELAHLLMGVLNYDKLASFYNSTVELPGIADAAAIEHKGDAAIAIKLGLLPAVNGSFLPDRPVTKADAAVVLLKLTELQGKTDTFMNWNSW